jgi:hypothetical protein
MLTCSECEQYISEYLDDRLAENSTCEMHAHCSECGKCRSFLKALLRLSLDSRRAGKVEVPVALDARVRSTIALSSRTPQHQILSTLMRKRIAIPIPIAAVLALFILVTGIYSLVGPKERIQVPAARRQLVTYVMSLPTISIENE